MGGDGREIAFGSTWNEALGLRGARESNCQVGVFGEAAMSSSSSGQQVQLPCAKIKQQYQHLLIMNVDLKSKEANRKIGHNSMQDAVVPHRGFCVIKPHDLKGSFSAVPAGQREKLWREFHLGPSEMVVSQIREGN